MINVYHKGIRPGKFAFQQTKVASLKFEAVRLISNDDSFNGVILDD